MGVVASLVTRLSPEVLQNLVEQSKSLSFIPGVTKEGEFIVTITTTSTKAVDLIDQYQKAYIQQRSEHAACVDSYQHLLGLVRAGFNNN